MMSSSMILLTRGICAFIFWTCFIFRARDHQFVSPFNNVSPVATRKLKLSTLSLLMKIECENLETFKFKGPILVILWYVKILWVPFCKIIDTETAVIFWTETTFAWLLRTSSCECSSSGQVKSLWRFALKQHKLQQCRVVRKSSIASLPESIREFLKLLHVFFPHVYACAKRSVECDILWNLIVA